MVGGLLRTGVPLCPGTASDTNTDEVYEILSEKMRDDYNISVSAPLGYNNTYAMSVRPEIAEQYQLETLTDLMAVAPELRLGCTADFTQREDALPRLESTFHTKFGEVNALDVAVRYIAIDSGQVDVIDAFATDALLSKFDLVQLEDDASFFPPYYAVNLSVRSVWTSTPSWRRCSPCWTAASPMRQWPP